MADPGPTLRDALSSDVDSDARLAAFAVEVARFGLRFRCAACAHVVPSTRACSMGYPNAMLRGPFAAREGSNPVICKYFELGESELPEA